MAVTIILYVAIVVSSLDLATALGEAEIDSRNPFIGGGSMSNVSPDEPDASSSENSDHDAASPVPEARPTSPTPQRPAVPDSRPVTPLVPLEAPLIPAVNFKSFRPQAPYSSALTPKPSAAPAPRLRPNAPDIAPAEISRAADPSRPGDQPLSAADEIAGMFRPGRPAEAGDSQASFDPAMLDPAVPPIHPMMKRASGFDDPLFFRRTIIPILLTFGVILLGWGMLLLMSGQSNALADLFPGWTPFALLGAALVFLALAIFNILSIKRTK
jgi:hypothetical protein